MKKTKTNKGITLIALIITIIILLILAMVSIRLITNEGILTKTEVAVSRYDEEQIREKIAVAYSDYKLGKYTGSTDDFPTVLERTGVEANYVQGSDEEGYIISVTTKNGEKLFKVDPDGTIETTQKDADLDTMERYVLGDNRAGGKKVIDIITIDTNTGTITFNDNDIIPNANTELEMFTQIPIERDGETVLYTYLKYNNDIYRTIVVGADDLSTATMEDLKLIYETTDRVGTKVKFATEDGGTEEEWTVLYDYGDTVELISPKAMGELTIGDPDRDDAKTIASYNSAITTINDYCNELITNSNKISARSLGSNPIKPYSENSEIYTITDSEGITYKVKETDYNCEKDMIAMLYCEIEAISHVWLSSRSIEKSTSSSGYERADFEIRYTDSEGDLSSIKIFDIWEDGGCDSYPETNAVRPIVKVNASILDGE